MGRRSNSRKRARPESFRGDEREIAKVQEEQLVAKEGVEGHSPVRYRHKKERPIFVHLSQDDSLVPVTSDLTLMPGPSPLESYTSYYSDKGRDCYEEAVLNPNGRVLSSSTSSLSLNTRTRNSEVVLLWTNWLNSGTQMEKKSNNATPLSVSPREKLLFTSTPQQQPSTAVARLSQQKDVLLQIQELQQELKCIKSQLWPAACEAAKTRKNQYKNRHVIVLQETKDQDSSFYETEARDVFHQARRACNPMEELGERRGRQRLVAHQTESRRSKRPPAKHRRNKNNSSPLLMDPTTFFVNRSAMKLASMDAHMNFSLVVPPATTASCSSNNNKDDDNNGDRIGNAIFCFSFVDLCGAPGGFSEYIFYRVNHPPYAQPPETKTPASSTTTASALLPISMQHNQKRERASISSCRGYGMSLMGTNEDGRGANWNVKHISKATSASTIDSSTKDNGDDSTKEKGVVDCYYTICQGADGTGDVYQWNNIVSLYNEIRHDMIVAAGPAAAKGNDDDEHNKNKESDDEGLVNLVVADGGFDAQRDSECQEELTSRLVVCQVAASLVLLRRGGSLVLKMFGFQTPVIRRLLLRGIAPWFDDPVLVLKPVLSRPASAERYVVFRSFRRGCGGTHHKMNGPFRNCLDLPSLKNGESWINNMMSLSSISTKAEIPRPPASSPNDDDDDDDDDADDLLQYLDACDRDMLVLNSKVCRAILQTLQEEATTATPDFFDGINSVKYSDRQQLGNANPIGSFVAGRSSGRPRLSNDTIDEYKRAWKLV